MATFNSRDNETSQPNLDETFRFSEPDSIFDPSLIRRAYNYITGSPQPQPPNSTRIHPNASTVRIDADATSSSPNSRKAEFLKLARRNRRRAMSPQQPPSILRNPTVAPTAAPRRSTSAAE